MRSPLKRNPASRKHPRTLYLGGGTPSMLSPGHLTRLFAALHDTIDFSKLDEVTLEANPATFDAAKARLFRELGVTRVSLGIQSFTPHVLEILGREHSVAQASESVGILREAGIPSVNIDLMFSIPGQSKDDWQKTLEHAVSLKPDHISAYNLTYEEDTAFFESLRRGEMRENEDHDAEFFHLADELLTAAGFDHYETSNYAKPGHHSTPQPRLLARRGLPRPRPVRRLHAGWRPLEKRPRHRPLRRPGSSPSATPSASRKPSTPKPAASNASPSACAPSDGISLDLLSPDAIARAKNLADEGLARIEGNQLILIHHGRALVDPIAAELV